ncbi:MAG: tetratricopeptide repeat protein, partial [candidate division NC10 bacterium]|nr:tetratricopeptide repeat protein [candidate division NC10 bacterium]
MLPSSLGDTWSALSDWFDRRGYYTSNEQAVIRQLARVVFEHPEKPEAYVELADFHQARGDYERAARVLARLPAHIRPVSVCAAACEHVLREGMRRLVQVVIRGLPGLRVGQAVARVGPGQGQMVSLHDLLVEDLLEVREVLFSLGRTETGPELEVRYLRGCLPDWRLERFLERETAQHRPDLKNFRVRMEGERIGVRCDFKGMPIRFHAVPQVASSQSVQVRFDPSPKLFWVVPIPGREVERAFESMAAASPPGFLKEVSADGIELDFAPLLAPLRAVLNLRHVEVAPGEVRFVAEALEPAGRGEREQVELLQATGVSPPDAVRDQ